MSLSSFGPLAVAYAARLPQELNVIVFDDVGFAEALDGAMSRAYRSGPFLAAPIVGDRRAAVAFDAARDILTSYGAYWKRRECLDLVRERAYMFGERSQREHELLTKKESDSIRDVLLASDGVLVRSWAELIRLRGLVNAHLVRSWRAVAPPQTDVPGFRPRNGAQTIVVWAPEFDALDTAMFGIALDELKHPVVIACANSSVGNSLGLRANFVDASDSAVLAGMRDDVTAIISADPDDPAATVELAKLGLPLAASFASGAFEYVDGLYSFDAWDFRSILHAALSALGGEAPTIRPGIPRPQHLMDDPPRLGPPVVANPPLVSVIMGSLNRHDVLRRAVESVAQQTYPNVEIVITNDGGVPFDHLVAGLPNVTLLNNDTPKGALAVVEEEMRLVQGKYVTFLADDDYFFPTHISRLVFALERTGGTVAVGLCAESYLQPGDDAYYDFIGTSIRLYRSTDPSVLQTIPTTMAITALAVRRDAAIAMGERNRSFPAYDDYEWHLRFLEHCDYIWISHLVANMDSRIDGASFSAKFSADERANDLSGVWVAHPVKDRPDIDRARREYLSLYRSGASSPMFPQHRGVTRIKNIRKSVYRLG